MKRQRSKLTNDDSKGTEFDYITQSCECKDISITETLEKSASLRVTKGSEKKKVSDERSSKPYLHIPIDLIVEILKRLPVKTLARFLCVSKLWAPIIRSKDFMKLFLNESLNRPSRLFFTFRRDKNCFLFSLNQYPNPGEVTYPLAHPVSEQTFNYSSCVHDLICYATANHSELVVYNSTTRRTFTLPKLEFGCFVLQNFLCYDPIDAVYKVLCRYLNKEVTIIKVLTLGNGNEWRIVKGTHTHCPLLNQICINGVLYYFASDNMEVVVVMSFDVRSEKFHLIKVPVGVGFPLTTMDSMDLINSNMTIYEGKPSIISNDISANGSLVLWVLQDALKHEWLKKIFVLPNSWRSLAHGVQPPYEFDYFPPLHYFLNITFAGEFILAPLTTSVAPFYVLYYDPKRNSIRKVSIEGIMEQKSVASWFLDHISSSQAESLTFW